MMYRFILIAKQTTLVISSTCFLFPALSLVKVLFWVSNHKKKCTLGGSFRPHTAGVWVGFMHLNLNILVGPNSPQTRKTHDFKWCCCEMPRAHGKEAATHLHFCATWLLQGCHAAATCLLWAADLAHARRAPCAPSSAWAADLAHSKTNGPGRRTWRARPSTCVVFVPWARSVCSQQRAAYVVCVVCAVSLVNLLTAYVLGAVCVVSAVSLFGSSRQTGPYAVSPMFGSRQPCEFW
jgi:hypothetical protein